MADESGYFDDFEEDAAATQTSPQGKRASTLPLSPAKVAQADIDTEDTENVPPPTNNKPSPLRLLKAKHQQQHSTATSPTLRSPNTSSGAAIRHAAREEVSSNGSRNGTVKSSKIPTSTILPQLQKAVTSNGNSHPQNGDSTPAAADTMTDLNDISRAVSPYAASQQTATRRKLPQPQQQRSHKKGPKASRKYEIPRTAVKVNNNKPQLCQYHAELHAKQQAIAAGTDKSTIKAPDFARSDAEHIDRSHLYAPHAECIQCQAHAEVEQQRRQQVAQKLARAQALLAERQQAAAEAETQRKQEEEQERDRLAAERQALLQAQRKLKDDQRRAAKMAAKADAERLEHERIARDHKLSEHAKQIAEIRRREMKKWQQMEPPTPSNDMLAATQPINHTITKSPRSNSFITQSSNADGNDTIEEQIASPSKQAAKTNKAAVHVTPAAAIEEEVDVVKPAVSRIALPLSPSAAPVSVAASTNHQPPTASPPTAFHVAPMQQPAAVAPPTQSWQTLFPSSTASSTNNAAQSSAPTVQPTNAAPAAAAWLLPTAAPTPTLTGNPPASHSAATPFAAFPSAAAQSTSTWPTAAPAPSPLPASQSIPTASTPSWLATAQTTPSVTASIQPTPLMATSAVPVTTAPSWLSSSTSTTFSAPTSQSAMPAPTPLPTPIQAVPAASPAAPSWLLASTPTLPVAQPSPAAALLPTPALVAGVPAIGSQRRAGRSMLPVSGTPSIAPISASPPVTSNLSFPSTVQPTATTTARAPPMLPSNNASSTVVFQPQVLPVAASKPWSSLLLSNNSPAPVTTTAPLAAPTPAYTVQPAVQPTQHTAIAATHTADAEYEDEFNGSVAEL